MACYGRSRTRGWASSGCPGPTRQCPRVVERPQCSIRRPVVPEERVSTAREVQCPVDVESPPGADPHVAEDRERAPSARLEGGVSPHRQMPAGAALGAFEDYLVRFVGIGQDDVRIHVGHGMGRLARGGVDPTARVQGIGLRGAPSEALARMRPDQQSPFGPLALQEVLIAHQPRPRLLVIEPRVMCRRLQADCLGVHRIGRRGDTQDGDNDTQGCLHTSTPTDRGTRATDCPRAAAPVSSKGVETPVSVHNTSRTVRPGPSTQGTPIDVMSVRGDRPLRQSIAADSKDVNTVRRETLALSSEDDKLSASGSHGNRLSGNVIM